MAPVREQEPYRLHTKLEFCEEILDNSDDFCRFSFAEEREKFLYKCENFVHFTSSYVLICREGLPTSIL